MGRFGTGVTVITFLVEGRQPAGMTANAFMSVSVEPPLVLTSIRNESRVNQFLGPGMRFGVNILAEGQLSLCRHFAEKPVPEVEVPFVIRAKYLLQGSRPIVRR